MLYEIRNQDDEFLFEVNAEYRKDAYKEIRELWPEFSEDGDDMRIVVKEVFIEEYDGEFDIYLNVRELINHELLECDDFIRTYKTKRGAENKANKLAQKHGCNIVWA